MGSEGKILDHNKRGAVFQVLQPPPMIRFSDGGVPWSLMVLKMSVFAVTSSTLQRHALRLQGMSVALFLLFVHPPNAILLCNTALPIFLFAIVSLISNFGLG